MTQEARDDQDRAARRQKEVAIRLGENILRCRRRVRMSQEMLARRAGLHRTEVGMLEHGQRGGRVDTLVKLAGAMAVCPTELLDGIDWVPAEREGGEFWVRQGPRAVPAGHPIEAAN